MGLGFGTGLSCWIPIHLPWAQQSGHITSGAPEWVPTYIAFCDLPLEVIYYHFQPQAQLVQGEGPLNFPSSQSHIERICEIGRSYCDYLKQKKNQSVATLLPWVHYMRDIVSLPFISDLAMWVALDNVHILSLGLKRFCIFPLSLFIFSHCHEKYVPWLPYCPETMRAAPVKSPQLNPARKS